MNLNNLSFRKTQKERLNMLDRQAESIFGKYLNINAIASWFINVHQNWCKIALLELFVKSLQVTLKLMFVIYLQEIEFC